jgi:Type I phosphodiesterase / nucleotide pyrophosphatase
VHDRIRPSAPLWLFAAPGGAVAFFLAATGSLLLAAGLGLLTLVMALFVARARLAAAGTGPRDPERRRFLRNTALAGLGLVAVGASGGRALKRLLRPGPGPALEAMAGDLGSEILLFMRRGHYPGRTGEVQLALRPFTISNYAPESLTLAAQDPRTSHAAPWMYLQRVPIVVYGPGVVDQPADVTERVTLADLAPTNAMLMGFDGFEAPDGVPLPGLAAPARPPRVIVTFVIDGGGWNILTRFPSIWPNIARLMRDGVLYRDGVIGSFPAVTAASHATIGTGAFPSTHGIVGHNMREGDRVLQPFGEPGLATTSRILVPTLAEQWAEHTGDQAWIGLLAYQIWHLSMIGHGGRPLGELPVGTYFDENDVLFAPQNPEAYRLPRGMPDRSLLTDHLSNYYGPERAAELDQRGRAVCCGPPVIRYQGDMIAVAFENEPIGADDVTDLVYINFKAPDYAGHVYGAHSSNQQIAMGEVDREVGRLRSLLDSRFGPGQFVLIVTADHGQSPPPDAFGGARVDPIQLSEAVEREFGPTVFHIVQDVKPSEIYLDRRGLAEAGIDAQDVAAFLADYRYGDNVGPYIRPEAIARSRLGDRLFAAALSNRFIGGLTEARIARYGPGRYRESDPGMPEQV